MLVTTKLNAPYLLGSDGWKLNSVSGWLVSGFDNRRCRLNRCDRHVVRCRTAVFSHADQVLLGAVVVCGADAQIAPQLFFVAGADLFANRDGSCCD